MIPANGNFSSWQEISRESAVCLTLLGGQNAGEVDNTRIRLRAVSSTAAPRALSVKLAVVAAEEALVTMGKGIDR